MKTPNLNCQLTLEVPVRTPDDSGGYETTWSALGTLWAQITAGSGSVAELSGLEISTVPYKIIVRAAPIGTQSRPKPGQRFRSSGRIYHILAVSEADRNARFLTCFAREEEVTS